jgi:transcriptional regulator with XRE-family HTH domain
MAGYGDRFTRIDQNIAANLRLYREAAGLSQEELAQRMTDRGFGFSQATIWKIESGQRPVRASELAALADALTVRTPVVVGNLTTMPGAARHEVALRNARRGAHDAYEALKQAADAYLEAQYAVLFAAHEAHNDGFGVTELHTAYLNIPAERAVIEARIEGEREEAQAEEIDGTVDKILDALRTGGYEPSLRIEDVEVIGGGVAPPAWAPPAPPCP